jgi:hypothetical protein
LDQWPITLINLDTQVGNSATLGQIAPYCQETLAQLAGCRAHGWQWWTTGGLRRLLINGLNGPHRGNREHIAYLADGRLTRRG